ncbi:cytidine deaminase [Reinekea marinisedimentorum]|uniref:Cytidine deaminase n=1 Tax=Reinekea marinisedimentorum TaxID=230495 RepID=A0A4V2UK85_9GAMM|nr:cytidine deaminase [Reinekea marinisedimentorum]TCS43212.1 cytidine deaminase [Reinekea marinisedimentorum]
MSETFDLLLPIAKEGAANAYAPYSNFQVGASILLKDGTMIPGSNVENASFGMTLCAERNAISSAVAQGYKPGDIKELVLYIPHDQMFSPCGACRQVMSEFLAQDAKVIAVNKGGDKKQWTVAELLPDGFAMPE